MAAGVPVWLWVEVAGVDPVVGGVHPQELPLVEPHQLPRLQLHDLIGYALVQGGHLPAAHVGCSQSQTEIHTQSANRQRGTPS